MKTGAHQAWNVYLHGRLIDTVFCQPDCDADYVKRGLIDHDGYDSSITVRRDNRWNGLGKENKS